jgi:hypothetical protein
LKILFYETILSASAMHKLSKLINNAIKPIYRLNYIGNIIYIKYTCWYSLR